MRGMTLPGGVLGWIGLLACAVTGCDNYDPMWECNRDSDCRGACLICDKEEHRCVQDDRCEIDPGRGCITDLDCHEICEYCHMEPGEDEGECRPIIDGEVPDCCLQDGQPCTPPDGGVSSDGDA